MSIKYATMGYLIILYLHILYYSPILYVDIEIPDYLVTDSLESVFFCKTKTTGNSRNENWSYCLLYYWHCLDPSLQVEETK